MIWLSLLIVIMLLSFAGVLLFGAPYLPTLSPQVTTALKLAVLNKGDTMLELGCGDGKVVVAAAEKGIKVVGYELNPFLAAIAWLRTRRYGGQVKIVCGNFWRQQWPPADAIFVFLLPRYMSRLDRAIQASDHRPVRLVSFAFKISERKPDAEQNGVYLYSYK